HPHGPATRAEQAAGVGEGDSDRPPDDPRRSVAGVLHPGPEAAVAGGGVGCSYGQTGRPRPALERDARLRRPGRVELHRDPAEVTTGEPRPAGAATPGVLPNRG